MKLIVADTGPVNYLIQIRCEDVLRGLVDTVILPAHVLNELRAPGAPSAVRTWANVLPVWVEVREPEQWIPPESGISEADRSAISLARELGGLLLMDDRGGRMVAARHAVNTIGTLGILEAAAAKKLIRLPDALARLQATSIFLSTELIAAALERDNVRREAARLPKVKVPRSPGDNA